MNIGMIAGNGQFPILFSKKAKSKGFSIHAVGINGETRPDICQVVDDIEWLDLGQFQRVITYFKDRHVQKAVMLGGVDKTNMFGRAKPDMKTVAILSKMVHTHDDALLRTFAEALLAEGIEILPSTVLLPELLAAPGCWTRREPDPGEAADIRMGYRVAKTLGEMDVGQSVVVAGGSVLAVEAIDGTDATIARGGKLARGACVVVKVSKPGQDLRFDVPAVGLDTLRVMKQAGATVLAVEAGKTLAFDREDMVAQADAWDMAVLAMAEDP